MKVYSLFPPLITCLVCTHVHTLLSADDKRSTQDGNAIVHNEVFSKLQGLGMYMGMFYMDSKNKQQNQYYHYPAANVFGSMATHWTKQMSNDAPPGRVALI